MTTDPIDTDAIRARYAPVVNHTTSVLRESALDVFALCDELDAARYDLAQMTGAHTNALEGQFQAEQERDAARADASAWKAAHTEVLAFWTPRAKELDDARAELARLRSVVRAAVALRGAMTQLGMTVSREWQDALDDLYDAVAAFLASEPKALPPIEEWPSTDGQWSTRNAGTASEPKAKSDDWTPTTTSERYNGKPLVQASEPKREGAQVGEATPAAGDQAARCTRCGGYINRHDSDCDQRETPPALTRAQARTLLVELEHGPYDGETYTEHYTREMEKQIKDSIAALRRIAEDV